MGRRAEELVDSGGRVNWNIINGYLAARPLRPDGRPVVPFSVKQFLYLIDRKVSGAVYAHGCRAFSGGEETYEIQGSDTFGTSAGSPKEGSLLVFNGLAYRRKNETPTYYTLAQLKALKIKVGEVLKTTRTRWQVDYSSGGDCDDLAVYIGQSLQATNPKMKIDLVIGGLKVGDDQYELHAWLEYTTQTGQRVIIEPSTVPRVQTFRRDSRQFKDNYIEKDRLGLGRVTKELEQLHPPRFYITPIRG